MLHLQKETVTAKTLLKNTFRKQKSTFRKEEVHFLKGKNEKVSTDI